MDPHIRLAQIALNENKTINDLSEIKQLVNILKERDWQIKNIYPNLIYIHKDDDFIRLKTNNADDWYNDHFHLDMTINDLFIVSHCYSEMTINPVSVYYYDREDKELKNNASGYWFALELEKMEIVEGRVILPIMNKSALN